ncbi:type II secretion system protein N [Pseudomonas halotolerans]|uniref:type II secretion system protein N n=1 Tax=Pseudomonas halotolerans TaxID=3143552 RepID=UPI0031D27C9A
MSVSFGTDEGLSKAFLVLVPLVYGFFLTAQEWHFRQALVLAEPIAVAPAVVQVAEPPNVQAVATVLGLTAGDALLPSAEPVTLQASFVTGEGLSRALLADAAGPRIYQVGERLPGGSVLRRVEASHVVLWRSGREERVALQRTAEHFLRRLDPATADQPRPHSSQYLRPLAGLSE